MEDGKVSFDGSLYCALYLMVTWNIQRVDLIHFFNDYIFILGFDFQSFLPSLLKRDEDVTRLGHLVRSYFKLGGHHIQFNVVDTATLKAAQEAPEDYKDLLVRMAGYSDYFNDMNADLQQEVVERTENESF